MNRVTGVFLVVMVVEISSEGLGNIDGEVGSQRNVCCIGIFSRGKGG